MFYPDAVGGSGKCREIQLQDLYKKSINLSDLFFKTVCKINCLNWGFYIESQRVVVVTNEDELLIFSQNVDILKDPETVKQLGSILKTNVRACKAVGHPFVIQLGRIYLDMLNVYKCLSENISAAIQANGKKFHVLPENEF